MVFLARGAELEFFARGAMKVQRWNSLLVVLRGCSAGIPCSWCFEGAAREFLARGAVKGQHGNSLLVVL